MKKIDLDVLLKRNPEVDEEAARDFAKKLEGSAPVPAKKGPELPTPYGGKRMMIDDRSTWADAPAIHYRAK